MNRKFFTRIAAVLLMSCIVLYAAAETTFSSMDLSSDSELLFSAVTDDSSLCSYKSLFLASLATRGPQAAAVSPEILTCFPQQMNISREGNLLEIRNNAGTAVYDIHEGRLSWTEGADLAYKTRRTVSAFMEPVSVSPDGNWKCTFEKTSAVTADIWLERVSDGKKILLSEGIEYRFDRIPVSWAPDSSIVLYEKGSVLYFLRTADAFNTASLTEEFRIIGKGNISNVGWANSRTIVYIDYDMVYEISANELQTRALYSDFLGLDKIAGRLPVPFDNEKDEFWVNEDVSSLVVAQNGRTLWYLELNGTDFDYVSNILSFPLMHVPGAAVSFSVFWTDSTTGIQYPLVWLEVFRSGERESYAYELIRHEEDGSSTFVQLAMPKEVSSPQLSPDGSKIAFMGDETVYVYNLNNWRQTNVFSGEKIISFVWHSNSRLFVGGSETVREWNLASNSDRVIFLSSVERFAWNADCSAILARVKAGTYKYDRDLRVWGHADGETVRQTSTQNGKWRVFFSESKSRLFTNGIYVRTLSGMTETRPLITDYTSSDDSQPRVALVIDALDNADGLTKILDTLERSNLKVTFFINGEFIRRFPTAVQEIVNAGHQCASMFFTTGDLTSMTFVADESYIRRGLARNEDEFFNLTGEELTLYWHAPCYLTNGTILEYGGKAGYAYVENSFGIQDMSTVEAYVREGVPYASTPQIIGSISDALFDGCVIPVSAGVGAGTRTDYLYDRLDVLIEAILEAGYRIVTVSEL